MRIPLHRAISSKNVSGFTLIELMIAMVLGLIVIGAVLALSLSMIRANSGEAPLEKIDVSPAKCRIWPKSPRSFIMIKKRTGPTTEPCGTPCFSGNGREFTS